MEHREIALLGLRAAADLHAREVALLRRQATFLAVTLIALAVWVWGLSRE